MNELKNFLNKEFGRNQTLKVPSTEKKNIKASNKPGFQNYRLYFNYSYFPRITKPKKPKAPKKSGKQSFLGLEITIVKDDNLEDYLKPQSILIKIYFLGLTQKQETFDHSKKLFK